MRKCERKSLSDTKVSEEREGEGAPGTEAEIPLKSMENNSKADIHTAGHKGPYARAGRYVLKGAVVHGKPTLEQTPGRICGPVEREEPMLEQVFWQDL